MWCFCVCIFVLFGLGEKSFFVWMLTEMFCCRVQMLYLSNLWQRTSRCNVLENTKTHHHCCFCWPDFISLYYSTYIYIVNESQLVTMIAVYFKHCKLHEIQTDNCKICLADGAHQLQRSVLQHVFCTWGGTWALHSIVLAHLRTSPSTKKNTE